MADIPEDVESLLKELRSYLANSNDAWERRRELMQKINQLTPGGEVDMFVGTVREMSRMGAAYANVLQTFQQLVASQQATANFADLMARNFAAPGFPLPGPFDYFKQMNDWMTSAAQPRPPETK